MGRYRAWMALAAAVFVVATVPFARSVRPELTNLDDYAYVGLHPEIQGGLTAANVWWAFGTTADFIYMPLTRLGYQLDWTLAKKGSEPQVMYAHSVALHGVNAVLLFLLFAMLSGSPAAAFFAALVWAVHPLRVESVAWISSRKDLVSMVGLLLALIAWVRFRRAGTAGGAMRWYAVSLLAFVLGLLGKPSVMTFPFLAATLDAFFLRRRDMSDLRSLWSWDYAAPLLMFVAVAVFTKACQDAGVASLPDVGDVPFPYRVFNAAVSYGVYLVHTALPLGLAPQCAMRYPGLPRLWYAALPVAAATLWFAWRSFRRGGMFAAAIVWYTFAIGPMLGIAAFGHHAFADRFTYIPSVGLSFLLLAVGGSAAAVGVRVAGVAVLAALAFRQVGFWRDDRTLFEHLLAVDGERNYTAWFNLAFHHWEITHDLPRSIECFRRGREVTPSYALTDGRGVVQLMALVEAGDVDGAVALLHDITVFEHEFYGSNRHTDGLIAARGMYFLLIGNIAQARDDLERLEKDPKAKNGLHVRYLRAKILGKEKGPEAEREELRRLVAARPDCCDYLRYRFLEKR